MTWMAQTYKDIYQCENVPIKASCCGRMVMTDMLIDVRSLQVALKLGCEFQCDGCREKMFAQKKITRVEFYKLLGAPQEHHKRIKHYEDNR